jgi:hypothetical protein
VYTAILPAWILHRTSGRLIIPLNLSSLRLNIQPSFPTAPMSWKEQLPCRLCNKSVHPPSAIQVFGYLLCLSCSKTVSNAESLDLTLEASVLTLLDTDCLADAVHGRDSTIPPSTAFLAVREFARFMILKCANNSCGIPSKLVEYVWNELVRDTKAYSLLFFQMNRGKMIDHRPLNYATFNNLVQIVRAVVCDTGNRETRRRRCIIYCFVYHCILWYGPKMCLIPLAQITTQRC